MKETASASPFAALSSQEQKEKWICWQCQHAAEYIPADEPAKEPVRSVSLPELRLPQSPASETTDGRSNPTAVQQRPAIHHGQYDAVIRRMKTAQRQAGAYTAWSEDVESTRQRSSGSEKASK